MDPQNAQESQENEAKRLALGFSSVIQGWEVELESLARIKKGHF